MTEIGDNTVEGALEYLKSTDEPHAHAKARHSALVDLRKQIKSAEFLSATGTIQAREAAAYTSDAYVAHIKEIEQAEIELQTMYNKRKRAELTIEVWRSINANQRRGNPT